MQGQDFSQTTETDLWVSEWIWVPIRNKSNSVCGSLDHEDITVPCKPRTDVFLMPAPKIWNYDVVTDFKINSRLYFKQMCTHTHRHTCSISRLLWKNLLCSFLSLLSNKDERQFKHRSSPREHGWFWLHSNESSYHYFIICLDNPVFIWDNLHTQLPRSTGASKELFKFSEKLQDQQFFEKDNRITCLCSI